MPHTRVPEQRRHVPDTQGPPVERESLPPGGVPGRRTITIRGRGTERPAPRRPESLRRRPERRYERAGFRADRAAMWAVLLGVMLILVAVTSAHAAVL